MTRSIVGHSHLKPAETSERAERSLVEFTFKATGHVIQP